MAKNFILIINVKKEIIYKYNNKKKKLINFEPKLKISNAINKENLMLNTSNKNLNDNNITEEYSFELLYTHLFAKVLSKFNLCYIMNDK